MYKILRSEDCYSPVSFGLSILQQLLDIQVVFLCKGSSTEIKTIALYAELCQAIEVVLRENQLLRAGENCGHSIAPRKKVTPKHEVRRTTRFRSRAFLPVVTRPTSLAVKNLQPSSVKTYPGMIFRNHVGPSLSNLNRALW
jgi:hypothetical protein